MRKTIPAGLLALGVLSVVWVPPAQSVDQAAIDRAIAQGVAALKSMQQDGGKWPYAEPGATALAGITLLECGVEPGDRSVAGAAQYVRQEILKCDKTYSIALAIIFLDLLGDPRDLPLIETLTVHLLAGQGGKGGWSYTCPPFTTEEGQRIDRIRTSSTTELRTRRGDGGPKRTARDLTPETQQQLQQVALQGGYDPAGPGDNSNTQFATLALWVARRIGMPVDGALARIENRFRQTQYDDGGWGYSGMMMVMPGLRPGAAPPAGMGSMMGSSASMTCAGLLGLLVAHGAVADMARERRAKPRDLEKDPQLTKGLAALSTAVDNPVGDNRDARIPQAGGKSFYFLWSLERVCVALELETLNKKDWYQWGAEILLANQQGNGSWNGEYGASGADTCFALLFLKKANLVRDLTGSLKGKLKDPSEAILKAGGVGGAGLKKASPVKLKPAIEANSKPEPERTRPTDTKPPAAKPAETVASDASLSARLAGELLKAAPAEQGEILQRLQETKGVENTEALAFAIPRLEGEIKQKAREALTARLARLKPDSLTHYLEDEEPEIRRAAALACAVKGLKPAIPKLIPRLRDREETVAKAAHAALKELSGKDLGASPADWEAWWMKQAKE
jgi:hypothetical protein